MLCDLPHCIQYKSNLIAHRFAPGGLWWKNIDTCHLFAKKILCVSIGIGVYVCILWVSDWHSKDLYALMILIFGSQNCSFHKCKKIYIYIFV